MREFLLVAVIGVITVVFATLLRKKSGELALLLTMAACVLIALLLVEMARPVVEFLGSLRRLAGLSSELMTPMLKAIGIGLLTQIAANVCADAGQNAVAKLIELCGSILALYVSIPLLEAVIRMIETMGGG